MLHGKIKYLNDRFVFQKSVTQDYRMMMHFSALCFYVIAAIGKIISLLLISTV
jgi:putative flippase GtrA